MCGIAIEWRSGLNPDSIKHRGIKKSELRIPAKNLKLTHFKLPFQTELDDKWDQPVPLENGNLLLFNGEIFNIPEGFNNDVEYLQDFFSEPDWLENIGGLEYNTWDGFWSIVILTDEGIYCFTDPLGQKQLYFNASGISSEMKAFENLIINEDFDPRKPQQGSMTPFKDVFRIIPNLLTFFPFNASDGLIPKILMSNLFDLTLHIEIDPDPKVLRELLKRSLRRRIHDLKDGSVLNTLFLSGGLDSTILLFLILELGKDHLFEFITIENGPDEIFVKFLEEQTGIEVRRISMTPWTNMHEREKMNLVHQYEHPIELGSLVPNYFLCKESLTRSLITGDGADELFSGYRRAQEKDTQQYDVFTELRFYHNIRLDRMASMFTKEVRSPFMGHGVVRWALDCPYDKRKGKQILKDAFPEIPHQILNRTKEPLRIHNMKSNKEKYQIEIEKLFTKTFKIN